MEGSLTEEQKQRIYEYLRFAKHKRDQHVREIRDTISEFSEDKIMDGEMYTADEARDLLKDLGGNVCNVLSKEVANAYHTGALALLEVLNQPAARGIQLTQSLLVGVEDISKLTGVAGMEAASLAPANLMARRPVLEKLGSQSVGGSGSLTDPEVARQRDEARAELEQLKDSMRKLQEQTTAMMREKSALKAAELDSKDEVKAKTEEISKLQAELAAAHMRSASLDKNKSEADRSSAMLDAYEKQLNTVKQDNEVLRKKAMDVEAQMAQMQRDTDGKLQDNKQFLTMKKMMQAKSQEVVTLRKKLQKYEPQTGYVDDQAVEADD